MLAFLLCESDSQPLLPIFKIAGAHSEPAIMSPNKMPRHRVTPPLASWTTPRDDSQQGQTRVRHQPPRIHPRNPQSPTKRRRSKTQVTTVPPRDCVANRERNSKDPAAAVRRHIRLLHDYNEIRDVALNFVGKIAEKERCRTIDVLRDYGMDERD